MPQIGEITYKSDPYEFIDYISIKDITGKLSKKKKKINSRVLDTLKTEINQGGLDLYATNINGVPIYHDKAVEIQQKISDIYLEGKEIVENLEKIAKQHRKAELNTYIRRLEERIREIKNNISEYNNRIDELESSIAEREKNYPASDGKLASWNSERESLKRKIESCQKELDGGFWMAHNGGLEAKLEEAVELLKQLEG